MSTTTTTRLHDERELSFGSDVFKTLFPADYMRTCLVNKVRTDARTLEALRAVQLQTHVVETAASSSLVKLGKTTVLTATTLAVGTPAVTTPEQGELAIQVHLSPLCSSRVTLGRPSEEAQSIGSQLTRIVLGSRVVELETLSIVSGQSAWKLLVDVYCIDHDGNVLDAALTSIMAALKTLQLPATSVNETDHVVSIVPHEDATPLRMERCAYATSFAVVEDTVLIDPTRDEEDLASAVFSFSYSTDGHLCGVHKTGGSIVAPSLMHQCMETARRNTSVLAELVDAST